jgi:gamma-glutamylcyclotransferase (GGCT)/AIG2-like uncharacterized protein YtfP
MSDEHLVFAEGKLQAGFWHDLLLKDSDCVAEHLECSFVPAKSGSSEPIAEQGVIYRVDSATLRNLDLLEGHPYLKRRELAKFAVAGEQLDAWVYRPMTGLSFLMQGKTVPAWVRK